MRSGKRAKRRKRRAKKMLDSIRYSMIRSYLECPYSYKLGYVDKVKQQASEGNLRGRDLHKAMELYILGEYGEIDKYLIDEDTKLLFEKIKETIRILPKNDLSYPIWSSNLIPELEFREHIDGLPLVCGRFDIVMVGHRKVRIVDLKTGWNYSKYTDLQGTIYTLGAKAKWSGWDVSVAFWLVRRAEIREFQPTLGIEDIKEFVSEIETDTQFKPESKSRTCRNCSFAYICEYHYKRR